MRVNLAFYYPFLFFKAESTKFGDLVQNPLKPNGNLSILFSGFGSCFRSTYSRHIYVCIHTHGCLSAPHAICHNWD